MSDRQPLQVFEAPLAGINLIEASAGTGKTHTITDLYVRLILETGRQVSQILVVTFTVAATAELRDRIRRRLMEAHRTFSGQQREDSFGRQLLTLYPQRQLALQRLDKALQGFDEAAIYTIHGFCERVLSDGAFESSLPFETELLVDEGELLQEIVDDFWRREVYNASPLFVHYLLGEGYSPEKFRSVIGPYVGRPYLKVVPMTLDQTAGERSVAEMETAFTEAYLGVKTAWSQDATTVEDILRTSAALNRNRYRLGSIVSWMEQMHDYVAPDMARPGLFERFDRFTTSCLTASVKRGQQPPQHTFFSACDALEVAHAPLIACYTQALYALKMALFDYAQRQLRLRKRRQQVLSYDDLLVNLQEVLASAHGSALANAIRSRYSAALIDEFQDTDPVQYRIFQQIYDGTTAPVFFVGDPKQAIYSFRGADIFAYLRASRNSERRYSLEVNWRSDPGLIHAVNTLFEAARQPFLFQDIVFHPVQPAPHRAETFTENGDQVSQLRLWFLGSGEAGRAVNKHNAETLAARATATEIARLLTLGARGEARLGNRPLAGGDIAVLVRTHLQGQRIRQELLRQRVASVQLGQDSVFNTWEAVELEQVLQAVANPTSDALLCGALATVMLGATGEQLCAWRDNEHAWEERAAAFHAYHRQWREAGFARMFRTLMSQERIEQRLLALQDGERRLTNVLHLAELLQVAADRQQTGMVGLLTWLNEKRFTESVTHEEEQLRLESDEHLVKVVTIHTSKGLEYPLVFCPFLWSGGLRSRRDAMTFHHPDNNYQAMLDLGSPQQETWQTYVRYEEAAENLRLLYVALTRARHCCYVVWGAIRDIASSPLAWLLHQPQSTEGQLTLEAVEAHVNRLSEAELWADLERYAARAQGHIRLEPLPTAVGEPYRPVQQPEPALAARHFPGLRQTSWRISSFSALTTHSGAELPDYDTVVRPVIVESQDPALRTIMTFPRGVRAGSCLHAIFERLDFTQHAESSLSPLVERCLAEHGFSADWVPAVTNMVGRVLATPLDTAQALSLRHITPARRLIELEFYYPLAQLTCEGLQRLLLQYGLAVTTLNQDIERLAFAPVHGYMKGFIDLVFEVDGRFYLADYKSNWLGPAPEAYHQEALHRVMAREAYYLQYVIYTVAVHRYLQLRLPDYDYDTHFGGVFYLFLRGMEPGLPQCGVFRDRPTRALIEALDAYLATGLLGG